MEKAQYTAEAHADVKAAERMGKLFDELVGANPDLLDAPNGRHALNIFFTRLLFCFFAEDTGIFGDNQFTNAVGSHTHEDGSDVAEFLGDLFTALDTERAEDKPAHLRAFPYVNGRLFTVTSGHVVPEFTKKARQLLIEAGTLIWREINPDIFGSMFQAIVTPGIRSDLGQHYTSVPNILKTIEPLFLDELKDKLDASFDSEKKLEALLKRIADIKIFDPACGSGNFLVIAYKELRRLEHAILERLAELRGSHQGQMLGSKINIENFFGIEIDDFAVEVAILSLWITKHQMNVEFKTKFGEDIPLIPLTEAGQIRRGNAARLDWGEVCRNDDSEIYLIGNPPYAGASKQNASQKEDYLYAFRDRKYSKKLNYIALWFIKGAEYISGTKAELAFVTTKTVSQGEHVGLMFPLIEEFGVEIGFAYPSFQWNNNAKGQADVTVSVISLRPVRHGKKYLFVDDLQIEADNINGYLADGKNLVISARPKPLSALPTMTRGSSPVDGGHLLLDRQERDELLKTAPLASRFLKPLMGSEEFINAIDRYCIWVSAEDFSTAASIPELSRRFGLVAESRLESSKAQTRELSKTPYRFGENRYRPRQSIVVPSISSGLRNYIPIGFTGPEVVLTKNAFAVYDAEPWLFSILTSRMHMTWVQAVCGRMRINYSYANTIVYNNLPVPKLSNQHVQELEDAAFHVLDIREYHAELTLADLYDPARMPQDLSAAHQQIDDLVDSIYSKTTYESDQERLSDLFTMYEAMVQSSAKAGRKASRARKVTR